MIKSRPSSSGWVSEIYDRSGVITFSESNNSLDDRVYFSADKLYLYEKRHSGFILAKKKAIGRNLIAQLITGCSIWIATKVNKSCDYAGNFIFNTIEIKNFKRKICKIEIKCKKLIIQIVEFRIFWLISCMLFLMLQHCVF